MRGHEEVRGVVRDATRNLAVAEANLGELIQIYGETEELSLAARLARDARQALMHTADAIDRRGGC